MNAMRVPSLLVSVLLFASSPAAQAQRQPVLPMPTDTATDVQARQRAREGQRLMGQDEFAAAATAFQEAIALDPLLVMAHHGLGTARMALKEYAAAAAAFEAARDAFNGRVAETAQTRENAAINRANRIRLLEDRMRNAEEPTRGRSGTEGTQRQALRAEIAELERLQEEGKKPPQLPAGLSLALGSAYFRSGRLADAEREYRAAIAAQPKLGEPRSNLAVVLLLMGRPAEAKEELKLAEKNGFKPPAGLKADIEAAIAKGK
jgi:tetratricopeptide (TPR) repeat protein